VDADRLEDLDPRQRAYRHDATLWVWIFYGLAQATITMLMAFDVIDTLTAAEVCTAVTLIVYVGVNELIVRPGRNRRRRQHHVTTVEHTKPHDDPDEPPPA
jgi:hypothetical protein